MTSFRFTFWAYVMLWIIGSLMGFTPIWSVLTRQTGQSETFLTVTALACFGAITLHQFLIYRSIHNLEEQGADSVIGPTRFVGSKAEIGLRLLIFIALLAAGGKMQELAEILGSAPPHRESVYALSLIVLFILLILWDLAALCVDKGLSLSPRAIADFIGRAWNDKDGNGRELFLISDIFGLIVSFSFFFVAEGVTSTISWPALCIGTYLAIVGKRAINMVSTSSVTAAPAE